MKGLIALERKKGNIMRKDGRQPADLREIRIHRNFTRHPEGSVLFEMGETRVLCTASVENRVPPFRKDTGLGWVTAEYAMLPRATTNRISRDAARGARSLEIQRLIGRSLRAVTDFASFGERTIYLDCDVIQADGGTRTAATCGAFIALADAFEKLAEKERIKAFPLLDYVAAVSVGIVKGEIILDLNYEEDYRADVDMNFVMTGAAKFIEVQGTAEGKAFSRDEMNRMADLADQGIRKILGSQRKALGPDHTINKRIIE